MKYEYELIDGSILKMALSKRQSKRLGALISVVFEESLPQEAEKDLKVNGFMDTTNQAIGYGFKLTDKGLDEKNRLSTLCGINIKYQSEEKYVKKTKETEKANETEATQEVVIGASEI